MATVRFSKELVDLIEKNARAKMRPAIERAQEQKLDNAWGQKIYDILFADVLPSLNQLPAGWVKTVPGIKIGHVAGRSCGMTFSFVTPQPWPIEFKETEYAKKEGYYGDDIALKDHLVWGEFLAEVLAYNERVNAAAQRQTEFVAMVRKVCDTYTTLAPALKAWPPLWELIPESYKDKHREIKEREKKEVVLDVDLGKLTALSTAAKFGV
jgi:hypothetical protein